MAGQAAIVIKHNFETAHRLPFLEGKCVNIHGHSWWVELNIVNYKHEDGIDPNGISVDFGHVKFIVRTWIDTYLDHGTMLGWNDALLQAFREDGSKVFVFGIPEQADHERVQGYYRDMPWPTVEAVARMISERIQAELDQVFDNTLWVDMVTVQETHVNKAVWVQDLKRDGAHASTD